GEDDLVTLGEVHRDPLAGLAVAAAGPDGQDAAPLRVFLGSVGQHDPAHGRLFLVQHLQDQPVSEWLHVHRGSRAGPSTGPRWFVDADTVGAWDGALIRS